PPVYFSSFPTRRSSDLYRLERRNQRQWQAVSEPGWQQQRVRSLLALLIASPERRVSRARAIEALWPGSDAEAGTANLNRALHTRSEEHTSELQSLRHLV